MFQMFVSKFGANFGQETRIYLIFFIIHPILSVLYRYTVCCLTNGILKINILDNNGERKDSDE